MFIVHILQKQITLIVSSLRLKIMKNLLVGKVEIAAEIKGTVLKCLSRYTQRQTSEDS